jgi:citrate lyase subunit beta/citryl-CoA lyase
VRPDSIVQPKVRSADDVLKPRPVSMRSRRKAASNRSASGSCRSPWRHPKRSSRWAAAGRCGLRLYGLTWGAEDLSAAIGATGNKRPDGSWTQPFQLARSLCLFAAGAAGVAAIDTLHSDIRDEQGLRASCAEARRDGFTGKLAIHPDQVAVINECFLPSADEIAHATRVIALFRDNPGVATLALDGQMLDIPHLRQAEQTLARASVQRG